MTVRGARVALVALMALAVVVMATLANDGCHTKVPPPTPPIPTPPPWYTLCIEASPRLNWYDQSAHTLFVRMFALSSLDGFLQAEMERLLDSRAEVPGVEGTPVERTIYPGAKITVDVPVRERVEFVGVVAGYYRLEGSAKSHRRLVQVGGEKPPCMRLGANAIEVP